MDQSIIDLLREKFPDADALEDKLDGLVHDMKGDEAAGINNGGVGDQLEYLIRQLGTFDDVVRELGGAE